MSVDCTGYIGYTVTLKRDLDSDDFDFFNDFDDEHKEYSMWEHKKPTEKVFAELKKKYTEEKI